MANDLLCMTLPIKVILQKRHLSFLADPSFCNELILKNNLQTFQLLLPNICLSSIVVTFSLSTWGVTLGIF